MKIAILNLMPNKIETEKQWLRVLSNSNDEIEITWFQTQHKCKTTPKEDLKHYKAFSEIRNQKFDGLIITGAPVEKLEFVEVDYWEELKEIFDFAKENVGYTLFICWAAPAALFHYYGIKKYVTTKKLSGVFKHDFDSNNLLMKNIKDYFLAPQSRYFYNEKVDITKNGDLTIVAKCKESGVHLVSSNDYKQVYINGHNEYDLDSIDKEYRRDLSLGISIKMPENYYVDDDLNKGIKTEWLNHSATLFRNWLNLMNSA